MRIVPVWVVILLAASSAGQTIEVDATGDEQRGVVLRLPWIGAEPERQPVLRAPDGHEYPAQVFEGELHAVLDSLPAGTPYRVTVEAGPKRSRRGVRVEANGDHTLQVFSGLELVTTYHYHPDDRKPYLWPVNSAGEIGVTRDYPMGPRDRTRDHPHHQSLWSAHGSVNGVDYWEYNDRTGWQETREITWGSGPVFGWIRAESVWTDAQRAPVIRESREYRFYSTDPARRFFDLAITLTADFGPVAFGDTKEGGMIALRMDDRLRERGGTGTMTNSEGGVGAAACWGRPARWLDYSGEIEGAGVRGVAIFDHPSSFRHPTHWHARDYGLVGANVFGLSDFTKGAQNGDHRLPEGESITFRYRVYVHAGNVEEARVAEYYQGFAEPAKARWAVTTR